MGAGEKREKYIKKEALVALERFKSWFLEKDPDYIERCYPTGMTISDLIQEMEAELRLANKDYKRYCSKIK